MIHTSSGCSFGKQSDIKREEEFYNPWLENLFNEIYKHFLTKKEIQEVLGGKDMWLRSNEVMERFKKRVDIINRETNKAKREHMKKLNSFMSNLQNIDAEQAASAEKSEDSGTESGDKKDKDKGKKKPKKPTSKKKE